MDASLTIEQAKFVEDNHNLIYGFLTKYKFPEDDWYDVAAIGLIKAAKSFKPGNAQFSTYAYKCMLRETSIELKYQERHYPEMLSLDYEYDNDKGETYTLGDLYDDGSNLENDIINQISDSDLLQFFESSVRNKNEKIVLSMLIKNYTYEQITEKTGYSRYKIDGLRARLKRKYQDKCELESKPFIRNKFIMKSQSIKSNLLRVGDKVKIPGERSKYIVRARDDRYIICTRPYNDTAIYFIIDLERGVRGEDNMIFCSGYETDDQCLERLKELQNGEISVSKKNYIKLDINVA